MDFVFFIPMTAVFLLALALSPGVAIALYIYLKDIHEPEPIRPLVIGLACGIVSFFVALGISMPMNDLFNLDDRNIWHMLVRAFVVVGLAEEFSKFVFVRGILYPNKNYNEPFDGIVYCVMIAMGFATTENILYVLSGGGGTAIVRMFTAVPAHAMFAVVMGYYLGLAKLTHTNPISYGLMALGGATVLHGTYDYFLYISFIPGIWIGAIVSLIIAYFLSHRAMELHQDASPFKEAEDLKS